MDVRKKLTELLADYFHIGDSYHYTLGRDKEAFGLGTMGTDDFQEYDDDTVAEIAEHLIDNGVTVQKWIPVSERLPERFKKVLCWYEYRNGKGEMVQTYDIGFYFKDDTWGGEVSNGYDTNVLAWMPLPEPPTK